MQVTMLGKAGATDALTDPNIVTGGIATDTFAPARLSQEQVQAAAAAQFGEMLNDIMQENIRLNSELNELRKKVDELRKKLPTDSTP